MKHRIGRSGIKPALRQRKEFLTKRTRPEKLRLARSIIGSTAFACAVAWGAGAATDGLHNELARYKGHPSHPGEEPNEISGGLVDLAAVEVDLQSFNTRLGVECVERLYTAADLVENNSPDTLGSVADVAQLITGADSPCGSDPLEIATDLTGLMKVDRNHQIALGQQQRQKEINDWNSKNNECHTDGICAADRDFKLGRYAAFFAGLFMMPYSAWRRLNFRNYLSRRPGAFDDVSMVRAVNNERVDIFLYRQG